MEKSTTNKHEVFPLILAAIGLLADFITIIVFYNDFKGSGQLTQLNELSIVLILFVMTYSWFTISWFIAKNAFQKLEAIIL